MLVELSSADTAWAFVLVPEGEEGGCLIARTLQLKLFETLLWASANLVINE